jgi:arginine/ornithine N-succinyltransferase beta subunit
MARKKDGAMTPEALPGLDARRASIDSMLLKGRYDEALQELEALTDVPGDELPAAAYGDFWLKRALCLLLRKRRSECTALLTRDRTRLEDRAPRHLALASAAVNAMRGDATLLRSATERFSQGLDWSAQRALQGLLAKLAEMIPAGMVDMQVPLDHHDWSVTSYSQWQAGLRAMLDGSYTDAYRLFRASMIRYELGQMPGDVLWSWFDAIVALLMLDQLENAAELYEEFEDRASTSNPHFETAALEILRAYKNREVSSLRRAEELMAYKWTGFKESEYPTIFRAFERKITTLGGAEGAAPAPTAARAGRRHRVLRCRPALPDDLLHLLTMAEEVNLGNTRADEKRIRQQIKDCHATLAGTLQWEQGLLYLVTEVLGEKTPELVGSCKLQKMAEGCWAKLPHARVGRTVADDRRRAEYEELVFDASKKNALEFSGNVVPEAHRNQGIAKLHGQARLLYLVTHGFPGVVYLYADLLTDRVNGVFPFYELIVRPLIGADIDYDAADDLRYNAMAFYEAVLGKLGDNYPPVSIPIHALPEQIRSHLGRVREQTIPAQKVLRKLGFRESNKYDLLDGGQYMEIQFADLKRANNVRPLTAMQVAAPIAETDPSVTFAPASRAPHEFFAVRAPAHIDDNKLLLSADLYRALELERKGEVVNVIMSELD